MSRTEALRVLVLAPAEDRADRAVGVARELAALRPAEVFVVRVLEEGLQPAGAGPGLDAERVRDLLVASESRELERIAEPLRGVAERVTTSVHWGVPYQVLLDQVERRAIDLVMKPARGVSHGGRVFFGATALHLFRKCPCPVWVVGEDRSLPRRILAAVDPGSDGTRRQVGQRVLGWAQQVAALSGAELEVVSCWSAPAVDVLKDELAPDELSQYVDDARARAQSAMETIAAGVPEGPSPARMRLVEGDARETLPRIAEEGGFDLVVMGTLGREGLAGELLGETAELVVRAVHSSVLTVSPRSRPPR